MGGDHVTEVLSVLKNYWENCYSNFLNDENDTMSKRETMFIRVNDFQCTDRKIKELRQRDVKVLKNIVEGRIIKYQQLSSRAMIDYILTIEQLMNQREKTYLETQQQYRRAVIEDNQLIDDYIVHADGRKLEDNETGNSFRGFEKLEKLPRSWYEYDRLAAVKYAERWWNEYNPEYHQFENDCTNFISQCVKEAGAPMRGAPKRSSGWWYTGNQWSFSWTVAHAFRWYLSGSQSGLRAKEVASVKELFKGDLICYDFNGDGNWQHTTIVVDKDADHMPLVNAHTTNSRMRYWSYEDSTAWTPNIQYKYFHVIDSHE